MARAKKRTAKRTAKKTTKRAAHVEHYNKHSDKYNVVIAFGVILVLLFLFDLASSEQSRQQDESIINMIALSSPTENSIGFVINNQIDPLRLEKFAQSDYNSLKQQLGVDEDFVISLRDDEGSVIPIYGKPCVGDPAICR